MFQTDPILLASNSSIYMEKLSTLLGSKDFTCHLVNSGKEAQSLLTRQQFSLVVVDFELTNHSSLEVLKFLKLMKQKVKILLYLKDEKLLHHYNLSKDHFRRIGVEDFLIPPLTEEKAAQKIQQLFHASSWRNIQSKEKNEENIECKIQDRELTRVPIKEVLHGNLAIFDHYLKLGTNKYVKIVHRAEPFPIERIENYHKSGCEFLYFLTSDRTVYINFMNDLASKMAKSRATPVTRKLSVLKNISDKFIEEIYTQGIRPDLVQEGKTLCQNTYEMISRDKEISGLLSSLEEMNPEAYSHSFLVTFISMVMCKNIPWVGKKAIDSIALGCLLHDIGMLKLPANLREAQISTFSPQDLEIFKQHPLLGAQMLQNSRVVNEQTRQIIYQHHENVLGTGYPNALPSLRIYPLAKIVSLADAVSELMVENKKGPKETMRTLLQDRQSVIKYDPNFIRALVKGLF